MTDTLNPAQREAVRYLDGPCLVIAGAGSGKTRVITQKVVHMMQGVTVRGTAGRLAALGRPIAGDVRYGGALVVDGEAVSRLMLHARALSFPHPAGGTRRLEAMPPSDMAALIAKLGLE